MLTPMTDVEVVNAFDFLDKPHPTAAEVERLRRLLGHPDTWLPPPNLMCVTHRASGQRIPVYDTDWEVTVRQLRNALRIIMRDVRTEGSA